LHFVLCGAILRFKEAYFVGGKIQLYNHTNFFVL
jgi:hypothetical protein